jgi:hypothetical protein
LNYTKRLGYDISIDSHSSKINNARIIHRFALADEYNVIASKEPNLPNIHAYFSELDCIFVNVGSVLMGALQPESLKALLDKIHSYKKLYVEAMQYPTARKCYELLELAKQFNMLMTSGLQEMQFFFRMGQRGKKGLRYIDELYKGKEYMEADDNDMERQDIENEMER